MRITDHMIFSQASRDVGRQRSSLYSLQSQAATGKKFGSIQEDPVGAERVRLLREAREAAIHYGKNITRSKTQLDAADAALGEGANLLIRAKEVAMAMGTETVSAEQRLIVASEIDSIFTSMVNLSNTQAAGENVFGGFQNQSSPFQSDGTYVGDSGVKEVDVGPDSRQVVNVSGEEAFTVVGGIDIFVEIDNLRVALQTNNVAGIQNGIDTMDQALLQVTRVRTDAGLKLNQLDVAESVRTQIEDSLIKEESSVIDIDPVKVFLELNETAKALQDALGVSSKVTSSSLLSSF